MADRVLCIEIGYSLTKVCEIERGGKNVKIIHSATFMTPEGAVNDGILTENSGLPEMLKANLSENRIRTKKAIFTIASSRIVTKDVNIPFVKENKIKDVVRAKLSDYFPVDPKMYKFSHSVIGVVPGENTDKAKGYRLMVLAAPKLLLDGYEKLAKAAGLEVSGIDYNGNSIFQAVKEQCNEGVELIAKIDERGTLVMVLDNGTISLNRTIPYGIDDAVGALMQTKELGKVDTYEHALELARRKTVILSNFKGELLATDDVSGGDPEAILADKKMVTDSFSTFASGMMRVIDYYNSNHSDRHIEKAYITGIGSDFSGLGALLNNELDIKVRNLTKLAGLDGNKVFGEASFGEFVSVIGASIAPVVFYADHDENAKGKKKSGGSGVNTLPIAISVLAICLIASGAAVGYTTFQYNKEKKLNDEYNRIITDYQPSYDIYQDFLKSETKLKYLKMIEKSGTNRNYQVLELFDYLEREMPLSYCLNEIIMDTETVTLDSSVNTKEEVAFVLDKLKDCELFSFADITSVSMVENELGEILYEFTVDLSYAPIVDEDSEEEVDEVEGE